MKIVRPLPVTVTGSFTRSTVGSYFDYTGTLQSAAINTPRFSFNPAAPQNGAVLLNEAAATNLLLNSAVVATQNISTTAGSYALSFQGTGSITLSGSATGVLTGVGIKNIVSLVVTATTGTVTLTVTGSCTNGQFEAGTFSTSIIPTTSAPVTRGAETNTQYMTTDVPENDQPVWSSTTTYAQGALVLSPITHHIYSSAVASNLNNPVTNTAYWVDNGADNMWRLFDQTVTAQCTKANNFNVSMTPNARYDSVTGLNCNASSCAITVVDPTYGVVYNEIVNLISFSGIQDMYAYFYEPIELISEFAVTDIPATYSAATINISFFGTNAAVGELVVGLSKELGYTDWTATASIVDYSIKTQDAFGNYSITPRTFQKEGVYTVQVPTAQVDNAFNILAGYRAIPIVYIGGNGQDPLMSAPTPMNFQCLIIYGFYKTCSQEITYEAFSTLSFEIEGLT